MALFDCDCVDEWGNPTLIEMRRKCGCGRMEDADILDSFGECLSCDHLRGELLDEYHATENSKENKND